MSIRQQIVHHLPPGFLEMARCLTRRPLCFVAVPGGWDQAVALSSGYDRAEIFRRVVSSSRAVKSGGAAFERDGVLFQDPAIAFQLAAPLLRHALKHDGRLEVVDFGGSLGSTFHQLRWFLPALRALRWRVVEQSHFVTAGRAEFETAELTFHESVDDLPASDAPRLVLLSSVLQYLASPYEILGDLSRIGADTMVIDRTPFVNRERDQLCVQHVPAQIYKASYPCWVFSDQRFKEQCLAAGWSEILRFPSAEGAYRVRGGSDFCFEGRILEVKR